MSTPLRLTPEQRERLEVFAREGDVGAEGSDILDALAEIDALKAELTRANIELGARDAQDFWHARAEAAEAELEVVRRSLNTAIEIKNRYLDERDEACEQLREAREALRAFETNEWRMDMDRVRAAYPPDILDALAPKPEDTRVESATCENRGHLWGPGAKCVFCSVPKSTEPELRFTLAEVEAAVAMADRTVYDHMSPSLPWRASFRVALTWRDTP